MKILCIAIVMLTAIVGAQTPPKPAKVPKPPKQATKGWHWEKLCPQCGKMNKGTDSVCGSSNTETWHSVMFTCKCGHVYGENYKAARVPEVPMVLVAETNAAPAKMLKVYKSPKLLSK